MKTYKVYVYEADELKVYTCEAADEAEVLAIVADSLPGHTPVRIEDLGPLPDNVIWVDFLNRKKLA